MPVVLQNQLNWRHRLTRASEPRILASHRARLGQPCYRERAFTLLEVILAIAILATALAAMGEVVRLAGENAIAARDLSKAQIFAASKMAEIASGAVELTTVPRTPLDTNADPPWVYQVNWINTFDEDLIAVHVTVEQDRPEAEQPIQFTLVRWMPDPGSLPDATDSGSSTTDSGSSTTDSGSSTSGSGSSTSGSGPSSSGGNSPTGDSGGR